MRILSLAACLILASWSTSCAYSSGTSGNFGTKVAAGTSGNFGTKVAAGVSWNFGATVATGASWISEANGTSGNREYIITVSAGNIDRTGSVVTLQLPEQVEPGIYSMQSENGERRFLQVLDRGEAVFVLEHLAAGETIQMRLQADEPVNAYPSEVEVSLDDPTLILSKSGSEVLSYFYRDNDPPPELDRETYQRAGYLHPVRTPAGTVVTNHLNVDMHPHHSGIWSAWTRTRFEGRNPDFWNPHEETGRVIPDDTLSVVWDGPVSAGFRTVHFFQDRSVTPEITALNEGWDLRLYDTGGDRYHLFDLSLTQTVNSSRPLILEEHLYGGLGFRGHPDWDDPENVTVLTSQGLGRLDGHATRSRWIYIGGSVEGETAGIVIMGHPENIRHPQPMRIHPEGIFFNYAPSQMGEFTIRPGEPNVMRYRFVTLDQEPEAEEIERLWHDYAYPPGVTVKRRDR